MLFLFVATFLAGILTAFIIIYYLFSNESEPPKEHIIIEAKLSKVLEDVMKDPEGYQSKESCKWINFILQFIFQEKQYDISIHQFLTNLLNLEFSELLRHKTLSKIIQRMQIQNLSLGNNFPVIKSATPYLIKFVKDSSIIDCVEIDIELDYTGGFDITIDAYSRIAKKAIVQVKVVKLVGTGRLIFSRQPFSHWGFTFIEEPEVKFDIQSSVLGHHIPRFRSIIDSQLRNVIRRKYVLPYYKLRNKPLIKNISPEIVSEPEAGINIGGKLNMCLVKFSRIQDCLLGTSMWCSISTCEIPVVCVYEFQKEVWTIIDVEISKKHQVPIGFVLKSGGNFQVVDSISIQSPSFQAGIKKGDIIIGVNGQLDTSGAQTARLINDSWNKEDDSTVVIRVKRFVISNIKNSSDQLINKEEHISGNQTPEMIVDENINRKESKLEETSMIHKSTSESERKCLDQICDLEDEDVGNAKVSHQISEELINEKSDREANSDDKTIDFSTSLLDTKTEFKNGMRKFPMKCRPILKYFETSTFESDSNPSINSQCDISLDEDCRFINICLWSKGTSSNNHKTNTDKSPLKERRYLRSRNFSRSKQASHEVHNFSEDCMFPDENISLVGYVNFSVENLINESSLNTMRHTIKVVYLNPANPLCPAAADHVLSTHKGFEIDRCYGDVMISVLYTPANRVEGKDNLSPSDDECLTDSSDTDEDCDQEREHLFHGIKRTHYSSATHCDFCRKKIWLKDAMQCSVCGIICHKKCMARCRQATACDISGLRYKEIRDLAGSEMPEIIMPDEEDEPTRRSSQTSKHHTLGAVLNRVGSATGSYISGSSMKRAGSAHNLCPPINNDALLLSRSLPPSPQITPKHSRKGSLGGNPFLIEYSAENMQQYLEKSLERVLSHPHHDSFHQLAKQSASGLLCQYTGEERNRKIEMALDILEKWINNEGSVMRDLVKREKDAGDQIDRTRISLQIADCDTKTKALALISMQYFTAQQLIEEMCKSVPKED